MEAGHERCNRVMSVTKPGSNIPTRLYCISICPEALKYSGWRENYLYPDVAHIHNATLLQLHYTVVAPYAVAEVLRGTVRLSASMCQPPARLTSEALPLVCDSDGKARLRVVGSSSRVT